MKRIMYLTYLTVFLSTGWSQTTGKLTGSVLGDDGSALVGANVVVLSTGSGSSADDEGGFTILNIPAGTYTVLASYIGYASQEVSNVRVMTGLSTEIKFSLSTSSIEGQVVQVVAEKPLIQKDETSSVSTVSSEQLRNMPIRDLNSVLATVPGVVVQNDEIHIRGGRNNEIAYYLNGAGTTNLANRSNLVYVPTEAVEELQVQVGGYDAEISGANSGVIKRSLKSGGSEYEGSFSVQNDGGKSGSNSMFGDGYSYGHQTVLASVSGPLLPGNENIKFYGAVESSKEDDPYVKVSKGFGFLNQLDERTDNSAYVDQFDLTWKDGSTPGAKAEFTNLTGTVTYDGGPVRATLGVVSNSDTRAYGGGIMSQLQWGGATVNTLDDTAGYTNSFMVDPRYRSNKGSSMMTIAELTYALSSNTILRMNVSNFNQEDEASDSYFGTEWEKWADSTEVQQQLGYTDTDVSVPVLNDDGDTTGYTTTTFGYTPFQSRFSEKSDYLVNGMSFDRPGTMAGGYYKRAYQKQGFSASLQHVLGNHDFKAGVDYSKHTIREYSANPFVMKLAQDVGTTDYTTYGSFDNIPAWMWRQYIDGFGYDHNGKEADGTVSYYGSPEGQAGIDTTYIDGAKTPTEIGFYIQDKIEFDDIIVNIGLRVDQLDPSETAPADAGELYFSSVSKYVRPDSWKKIEPYTEIQPRIGISFPFTDKTNVYGYYGRFSQLVDLNSMYYTARDYRTQMGVGGNFYNDPIGFGLEPVRTTQYEIGFKQQVSNNAALKVTGFYKNQKGLIQADRSTPTGLGDLDTPYNYVRNGDFATTKGLEFSLSLRRMSGLTVEMNYTAAQAEGTGSGRSSYLAALDRGSMPPTMINPVDFNQTHAGSINLDYRLSGTQTFLDGLGSNLLFTFNSGHAFTYVYRPVGGQVSAFDAGVDYMDDTRSRQALEPVGASTTPWVYNLDLKLDKDFTFGNYSLKVFARVNNLLDRRNALNVYQATGSASDDGFYGNEVYSESFVDLYGDDPDGDGVTDYEEMYRAINIDNDESYRLATGDNLISAPRQVFLGFAINF